MFSLYLQAVAFVAASDFQHFDDIFENEQASLAIYEGISPFPLSLQEADKGKRPKRCEKPDISDLTADQKEKLRSKFEEKLRDSRCKEITDLDTKLGCYYQAEWQALKEAEAPSDAEKVAKTRRNMPTMVRNCRVAGLAPTLKSWPAFTANSSRSAKRRRMEAMTSSCQTISIPSTSGLSAVTANVGRKVERAVKARRGKDGKDLSSFSAEELDTLFEKMQAKAEEKGVDISSCAGLSGQEGIECLKEVRKAAKGDGSEGRARGGRGGRDGDSSEDSSGGRGGRGNRRGGRGGRDGNQKSAESDEVFVYENLVSPAQEQLIKRRGEWERQAGFGSPRDPCVRLRYVVRASRLLARYAELRHLLACSSTE